MVLDRTEAQSTRDGIILVDDAWLTSGVATPTHSGKKGDRYYKTDGTVYRLDADGSDWKLAFDTPRIASEFSYDELKEEGSTFVRVAAILFQGSNVTGPLSKILIAGYEGNGTGSGVCKIFDVTNGNKIAEKSYTNTTIQEINMGAITSVPTGPAVFEVQLKGNSDGEAEVYALRIEYA